MDSFFSVVEDHYVEFIANLGLLALAAWAVSFFRLLRVGDRWKLNMTSGPMIGGLFGTIACILMYIPADLPAGVLGDARGAPILLSGMVAGPVAALIAGTMSLVNRVLIGGPGMEAGLAFITLMAVMGGLWRYVRIKLRRQDTSVLDVALFTAFTTALAAPVFFLVPEGFKFQDVFESGGPVFVLNLAGAMILTVMLRRDGQTQALIAALEHQKASAEQGQRTKSTFLANMSHELRTPLNAILGFAEILSRDQLRCGIDPKYQGYAEDIRISGQYLLSLLNDILDLSKIEAGKYEVTPQIINMAEVWGMPLANARILARRNGVELNSDEVDPGITVHADQRALQQSLLNIVGNAIKYTPEGGTVTCRTVVSAKWVDMIVEDTGPGIPPEDLERIIQPFEQTYDPRTKAKPEGTGLGLSITNSLLQMMGGTLEIQSQTEALGAPTGTRVILSLKVGPSGS